LALWLNSAAQSLFATFFPADCRICGIPLLNISRTPVCPECVAAMPPVAGATCGTCGERLLSPFAVSTEAGEPRCGLCRRQKPPFERASAYGSYEGGLRELIHLLKYERVEPAADVLGRMLAEAIQKLQPGFAEGPLMIVPVPLHAAKRKERGFNQSELIIRTALKVKDSKSRLSLHPELLRRRRPTQSQIGLTRHQRRENMRGAFVVTAPELVSGREILLIDDVFTTGTTVSECARVLRRAGASKVWVATVARTLKLEAPAAMQPREESALADIAQG
jgi:ComF family protein